MLRTVCGYAYINELDVGAVSDLGFVFLVRLQCVGFVFMLGFLSYLFQSRLRPRKCVFAYLFLHRIGFFGLCNCFFLFIQCRLLCFLFPTIVCSDSGFNRCPS